MSSTKPELPQLLEEFVAAVWSSRSDLMVIRTESDWPPRLWLVLAEQVPANTPAIAVRDAELIVGYRLVPLEIDSSTWLVLEGTNYGRMANNFVRYDHGWKLDEYIAAGRTPVSPGERARMRRASYRFADA